MSKQFKFKVGDRVKIPDIKFGRPLDDENNMSAIINYARQQGHNYLIVSRQPSGSSEDCYVVRYKRNNRLDAGDYFYESDLEYYEPIITMGHQYKLISDVWLATDSYGSTIAVAVGLFERYDDPTIKVCIRVDIKTGDVGMAEPDFYKQTYTLTRLANDNEFDMLIQNHD